MAHKDDYIAVFDSGVGGISVLRHLLKELPQEKFLYFGDSINAPYGVRTRQEVEDLTMAALEKLLPRGLKAFVIACNTATAAAVEALRAKYPELVIVGIEPAVKLATDRHPGGHIGVMATPGTLKSPRVLALIDRFRGDCTIEMLPAPGLADLVEANKQNGPEGEALLRPWLDSLVGKLDALVLGCTHYPFATPMLNKILGDRTELLDGGPGVARQTKRRLEAEGLLREGEGELLIENSLPGDSMIQLSRQLLEV